MTDSEKMPVPFSLPFSLLTTGQMASAGQQDVQQGSSKVADAMKPIMNQIKVDMARIASTNIFGAEYTKTMTELQTLFQRLSTGFAGPVDNENKPEQGDQKTGSTASSLAIKPIEADHFAKLGLFISGAPQAPGLSEARRTAKGVEETVKLLNGIKVVLGGASGPQSSHSATYA